MQKTLRVPYCSKMQNISDKNAPESEINVSECLCVSFRVYLLETQWTFQLLSKYSETQKT